MEYRRYLGLDLKAAYQRNMIYSILTVYLCVSAGVVILQLLRHAERQTGPDDILVTGDASDGAAARVHRSSAQPRSGRQADTETRFTPRFVIVADYSSSIPRPGGFTSPISGSATDVAPITSGMPFDSILAEAPGVDGSADFGLPEIPLYGPMREWPLMVENAWAYIPDPVFPRSAHLDDTGRVEMELTIARDGTVSWKLISETPAGRGFANAVIEALRWGHYSPLKVNGTPREMKVKLLSIICLSCEPDLSSSVPQLTVARSYH